MLIRVLGMDSLTLQQLDPKRYDLPLLDTQTITNPQPMQRFSVPPQIWQTPPSRYLLAIGLGDNGSSDIRIMRILPSTLNIITLGGKIIAGTRTTQSAPRSTITLFQEFTSFSLALCMPFFFLYFLFVFFYFFFILPFFFSYS